MDNEHIYFAGQALKALPDGRIGGYLVAFGKPYDLHGEYFHSDADFALDWYDIRPILYHHGLSEVGSTRIGVIVKLTKDAFGIYAEGILDINHEDPEIRKYARMAYDLVNQGRLGWSSGSIPHLVQIDEDGGIRKWAIVEGSLTPTPAEPKRTTVTTLKHACKAMSTEATPIEAKANNAREKQFTLAIPRGKSMDMNTLIAALETIEGITPEMQLAILKQIGAAEAAEDSAEMETPEPAPAMAAEGELPTEPATDAPKPEAMMSKTLESKLDELISTMKAQRTAAPSANAAPPATTGKQPAKAAPIQVTGKYAALTAGDISYLYMVKSALAQKNGQAFTPDQEMMGELLHKAQKAESANELHYWERPQGVKFSAMKADELVNTTFPTAAGNWVPTLWLGELWRRTRLAPGVAQLIRNVSMPSPSYEIPIESTDPTVYHVAETQNEDQLTLASSNSPIPDSKMFADKVTLTATKLGIRVGFSVEQDEDSIIQFIPQLREQALVKFQHAIDGVILNGDTETGSTNINYNGASAPANSYYLGQDGARKLALVTNTALSINMNGQAPTLQKMRELRSKMQNTLNFYGIYPSELAYVVDPYTWFKLLNIDEINVFMNNGRMATVNSGEVPAIDNIPVIVSEDLLRASTNGYVSSTAADNLYGNIVLIARNGWYLGYRRDIKTAVDYLSYYDSYQMTLTARIAVENRDTVCSAVMYNIAV